jgi:hypothetical protein
VLIPVTVHAKYLGNLSANELDPNSTANPLERNPSLIRPESGEGVAIEWKELTGLRLGRVRERGSYLMLKSDLMAWQVGCLCIFPHSGATRNQRNFEEERQRTLRQC